MITYNLEVSFADSKLEITDEIEKIIAECTKPANETTVSQREKRTFTVTGRKDENTIFIQIITRNPVNPTRSLSTLARRVLENDAMSKILKGHTPNGSVFKAKLINSTDSEITYLPDTEIVSNVVSIFFKNDYTSREKEIAETAAEKIRDIVIDYVNKKNNL